MKEDGEWNIAVSPLRRFHKFEIIEHELDMPKLEIGSGHLPAVNSRPRRSFAEVQIRTGSVDIEKTRIIFLGGGRQKIIEYRRMHCRLDNRIGNAADQPCK